jgi:hypothetical protein
VKHPFLRVGVISVLIATYLSAGAGSVAAQGGACVQIDDYQAWEGKNASAIGDGSTYFDRVRGDAYVRNLALCIGNSGGTWVLPANVDAGDGRVLQIGYGRRNDFNNGNLTFVATDDHGTPYEITSVRPVLGHRYRFEVVRNSGGYPTQRIYELRNGSWVQIWSTTTPSYVWNSDYDHAWWGYEVFSSQSSMGSQLGSATPQMAYMGYSGNASSTISYRSGLTSVAKNYTGQAQWVCSIGDWVYGDDMLNCHD